MEGRIEHLCVELGRLRDKKMRATFLADRPELLNAQLVKELGEAVRTAVRVDVRQALDLAEAALAIAHALRDPVALAIALRAKANALWFQGDCRAAVRLYRWAAWLFERTGRPDEVARTLSSSIQSLALLGEYDKASAAAGRARKIFAGLGEAWRVARVDLNLANIYHRQNRYREALAVYERVYRQLLAYRDAEGIGVALHNMAVCLIALDDFKGALTTYERVHELCSHHEMPLLVAQADYNIAFLYYLRGDYTKALELLRSTREVYQKNGDHYHLSLCDLDRSEIYLELCMIDEAAEMAHNSLEHFEALGMKFERARALINFAVATNAQGDSAAALQLFRRAREITVTENNPVWPHFIDLYVALVLLENDEANEARSLCISAAAFFRSVSMPTKRILSLLVLARACTRMEKIEEAASRCDEAIRELDDVDAPILFYQAWFVRGQIFELAGKPEEAYNSYQKARSALELLRSSLQRQELKIGFMRNRLDVYSRLVQLCLEHGSNEHSTEEALSYIEAAKCRTLRDLILEGTQPDRTTLRETKMDAHVRDLREELNWYYHRVELEQLSPDGMSVQNQVLLRCEARSKEHELARVLLEMPEGGAVGIALRNSSPATLEEIRAALGAEAALLEYFAIGQQIFVAAVTTADLKILPVAPAAALAHSLRMLQFQLSKFRLNKSYVQQFREALLRSAQAHLRALYDHLIAPVNDLLAVRDLVIVPFGPLHSLPFHALFNGREYLIDKFNLCYEPSASLFTHCHRQIQKSNGPSLVLGIDDPKLPYIQEELQAVAAAVPEPRVLFGSEATERALREYGHGSDLIHIASHGIFRQDNPLFSSIRLAGSYLTLYDLYHMNLPVDLLTLSGCVTGLNVVAEGDELLGLTRGLLYAGAKSLLLSLWDVDDRSTSEFMKEFYQHLQTRRRKADAVRAAMLKLREQYPHPYFWAPFKLTGRALRI
ncbi:MAG TPA: CHAT domain-containing tetratricopeptide repeat protein [Bryobacteraceae bacterium]